MNVIYVYLIFRKKGYAFGSLSAVFDYLTEDDVGIKENYPASPVKQTAIDHPESYH